MRLLSALALTLTAACAIAFASCETGDGAPEPPPGVDGGMSAHNPSSDAPMPPADVFMPADAGQTGFPADSSF
jgi:hypothetical protein